jgi:hypothetical protein
MYGTTRHAPCRVPVFTGDDAQQVDLPTPLPPISATATRGNLEFDVLEQFCLPGGCTPDRAAMKATPQSRGLIQA